MRFTSLTLALLALDMVGALAAIDRPFSFLQTNETTWLVKPAGERFFSFGVCVVDRGAAREDFNPTNPGYAAFRFYESSNQWAKATLQRLKSWNFTTIGGWSDFNSFKQIGDADVAFTPELHVGASCGVPWWDMWDTNIIARMHQVARDQILPLCDDQRLLGYYSDNEMGWWNAILFKMTLEQKPASGQRQRLIQLLRDRYQSDWSRLLKDFEPEGAQSFEELDRGGMLYLRGGSNGIRVYRKFLEMMADRYYSLVREVIRTYDQRGLILGDRYQSFFYPEVARACGRHVDAVSGNLNAAWNDGTFARYYLDTLHALTGKPIMVSEFYMAARQNRSGNKNDSGTFPTVETQKERTAGFRATIEVLLRIPYVVGADWFQYYDEPGYGRGDGENFNFGLVDIYNKPYEGLTGAASGLDAFKLKSQRHGVRTDASLGVPPAPHDPFAHFQPMLALKEWDRERGFIKPASEFPVADLYACWNEEAIFLGLYAQDIFEKSYYKNGVVPEVDRSEWVISAGQNSQVIRARIGGGAKPVLSPAGFRLVSITDAHLNTRTIAVIEIPSKRFGRSRFEAGNSIELASTFFTHCKAERIEWKGLFRLRK